ncbi:MAG: hypothetical protein L3K26_07375 [Candidatus Hydrogenedentes bacterium]|nr:hypothetical protein [Candidatus Hydrogenedentota bacterium]
MAQIKRFGVLQTSKVVGVLYFLGAAVFCIPLGLITMVFGGFQGQQGFLGGIVGGIGLMFLPLLYGAVSFVMVAIGCAVYNLVAGFVGGIEIELEE